MGETVVVDASVIAKWYLKEEWRKEALSLRRDYIEGKISLTAPAIMPFEVLNAVKFSRKDVEANVLEAIAESLSLYGIKLYDLEGEYAKEVARLAIKETITVYDASYVALAKILNSILYTADEKLVEEVSKEHKKLIEHIRRYRKGKF